MEILAINKKTKKVLITVSGLDGSGKSTQAKLITEYMPNSKIVHIVDFRLVNKILNFRKSKKNSNSKNKLSKNKIVGLINLFLLFLDMLIFKIYFKMQKKSIVCDRFFYDLIASHTYRYGDSFLIKQIIKFIPQTDLSFFIEVDENIAQKREQDGFHEIEYFQKMTHFYNHFFDKNTFIKIKSSSVVAVKQSIFRKIQDNIGL